MILTEEDCKLVVGALDSLGVALADHDHQWTDGERAIYEEARSVLGEKSDNGSSDPNGNEAPYDGSG